YPADDLSSFILNVGNNLTDIAHLTVDIRRVCSNSILSNDIVENSEGNRSCFRTRHQHLDRSLVRFPSNCDDLMVHL
ncbi:hypothetical protein PMAYCL1PPCAC_25523, partial [Pristionchus mayeri]